MTFLCLGLAFGLTLLLGFVSHIQLLYLESIRIIRRETQSLQYFRETLASQIGLELELGSLSFSLVKHVLLFLIGVFYLCTLVRPQVSAWQAVLEAIFCSLLAMIVFVYLLPLLLYRRSDGHWLTRLVPLIKIIGYAGRPLAELVRIFGSLLDLDSSVRREDAPVDSAENVEAFIAAGAEEGILEEEDRKLIQSVVAFGDKSVREVMTPRPSIVAISVDKSLEDLRQLVIHEQYSRIPVYRENIDNMVGFVHVRDMFELDEEDRRHRPLGSLLRKLPLVPETKPVSQLLRQMQHDGSHMVVVVDEYGNTAGLATMEDVVEEILGEIRDEHEPDRDVKQEADHVFVASGSLDLDRLHDLLEFRPEEDTESTTVGGLVTEWLGHVPKPGESVQRGGIRVEVLAANDRRVEEVRVSRAPTPTPVGAGA